MGGIEEERNIRIRNIKKYQRNISNRKKRMKYQKVKINSDKKLRKGTYKGIYKIKKRMKKKVKKINIMLQMEERKEKRNKVNISETKY